MNKSNISDFYDGLSSDSASEGENLDKLKELFSGKKNAIKPLLGASPPNLVKNNTVQAASNQVAVNSFSA